jgi:uncharacterized protein YegP (UPF0339 family)
VKTTGKVQVYRDTAGEWRWRKVAANGEPIAVSGEGYVNWSHAEEMARRELEPGWVIEEVPTADELAVRDKIDKLAADAREAEAADRAGAEELRGDTEP